MAQNLLSPKLEELLAAGGLFEGKYRLLRHLGSGGFATVLHAEHEAMGREVALKFLRPDVMKAHPEVGKRFLLEVKLASRLTSPHTVTIFDFGETDESVPFMVLEYVKGKTLDEAIEKHGALGIKRSLKITLQILDSLQEAHGKHIIHRDLKPANIMVGRDSSDAIQIKVLDFGVAKLVEKAEETLKTKSGRQSTQFIGTPRYMSPEQILGQKVSPSSDIYSLGLILYEMCTGLESIPTDNVAKVAQLHLSDAPLPLKEIEELPKPISALILRATSRRPEDRFQDGAEFQRAIEEAISEGKSRNKQVKERAQSQQEEVKNPVRQRTSDVFAGRAYVDLPEDSEATLAKSPRSRPSPTGSSRGSGPHRNASRIPSPILEDSRFAQGEATNGASGSRPLELDMDRVRQADYARQRSERSNREIKVDALAEKRRSDAKIWVSALLTLGLTALLSFIIVGGALSVLGTPLRTGAATLPLLFSLVWAFFSANAYPDLLRHRVLPWAKRSAAMLFISLLLLALLMPESAGESLQGDSLWFTALFSESPPDVTIIRLIESFCDALGGVLRSFARFVPWS